MLTHEHIRIAAVWIGAWTESKARREAECTTTRVEEETPRDRADSFAQLRRLAHHRYHLCKKQQRTQRPNVIPQITSHGSIGLPATLRSEDINNGHFTHDALVVVHPESFHDSERDELAPAPEGELRSLQDTAEHQYEPPQLSEAASDRVELQVEEQLNEPPRNHDAAPEMIQLQVLDNLQSCNKVQSQVDEPSTRKELPSIAATCTAGVEKIDPRVKSILSSVTFTGSPSFTAWTPCEKADEHRMSLSNVEFRECEQSGLQLKFPCEMVNVTFIGCKFNRMAFMDMKLSNVTFRHVDFTRSAFYCLVLRNVTLTNLRFENDLWRTTHLENAFIRKDNFTVRQGTIKGCYLRAPAVSSKTIQFCIKDAKPLDKLNKELGHIGAWKRDIYRRFGPSKRNILTRLVEWQGIIDRIMRCCFPGSNVHIYEYPCGFKIPRESLASSKFYLRRSGVKTAYFGSLKYGLSVGADPSQMIPPRGVGDCTSLLLVNKSLSELALKHLYSRTFHLQWSAEGAREFLLAHTQQMKMAKALVLYYHWADDKVGLVTDINAWRYLLGTIRHQLSFIPKIRLYAGRSFWKRNRVSESAKSVLGEQSNVYCPLGDAHKFAAPDDRWRYKDNESTHRTDGTVLQIYIEDTSNQIKTDFVQKIFVEIEKQRVGRPLFVRSPKGEEITYRCANQFRGD